MLLDPLSKSTVRTFELPDLREALDVLSAIVSKPGQVKLFQLLTSGSPFGAEFLPGALRERAALARRRSLTKR